MIALKRTILTIDLGRASKRTRGAYSGFSIEGSTAPFIWWPVH